MLQQRILTVGSQYPTVGSHRCLYQCPLRHMYDLWVRHIPIALIRDIFIRRACGPSFLICACGHMFSLFKLCEICIGNAFAGMLSAALSSDCRDSSKGLNEAETMCVW